MTVQIRFPRMQKHLNKAKPPQPWGLCDPQWQYVPAASTDVQRTWRKFGWTPSRPNEHEGYTPTNKQEK